MTAEELRAARVCWDQNPERVTEREVRGLLTDALDQLAALRGERDRLLRENIILSGSDIPTTERRAMAAVEQRAAMAESKLAAVRETLDKAFYVVQSHSLAPRKFSVLQDAAEKARAQCDG